MTIDEFRAMDLRIAKILRAEKVEGSEKLTKLEVGMGAETRQIVAGIGKAYEPAQIVGREVVIVANLEPRKFSIGQEVLESQGMLLAARDENGNPVILVPEREVAPGTPLT